MISSFVTAKLFSQALASSFQVDEVRTRAHNRLGCRFHRMVSMVSIVPRSRSGTLAGSAETSALIQAAEISGTGWAPVD